MLRMARWFSKQPRYNRIMGSRLTGNRFFVIETGECDMAYQGLVKRLKNCSQTEAYTREACDYYLVFCPITSRVGTDIGEAERRIPDDKPVILVVMHHTHNPDNVIVESRRNVTKPNIKLTVDYLFYTKHLLNCNQNDIAFHKIQMFLGVTEIIPVKKSFFSWRWALPVALVFMGVAVFTLLYFVLKKD